MQSNEEDKQHILQQLKDMFSGVSLEEIRNVCQQSEWNVGRCVDKLIKDADQNGTTMQESESSSCGTRWDELYEHGAVPKIHNSTLMSQPKRNIPPNKIKQTSSKFNNNVKNSSISSFSSNEQRVCDQIRSGFRIMVIMRGCPGSGKSYLAKSIVTQCIPISEQYTPKDFIFSADDFFFDAAGRYKYNVERLSDAHAFNQRRVKEKAVSYWSPIIVDNTNIQLWEMMPYVQTAVRNGYLVEILEPMTPWRNSVGKLAIKNIHQVPREKIQIIMNKYEKGNVNDLMKMLKETKYTMPLPQMRKHPPVSYLRNTAQDMETNEKFQLFHSTAINDNTGNIYSTAAVAENSEPTWCSQQNTTVAPKPQRESSRLNLSPQAIQFKQNLTVDTKDNGNVLVNKPSDIWKPYEQEAKTFWGIKADEVSKLKPQTEESREEKTLLDLLKEGVCEAQEIDQLNENKASEDYIFIRHTVNCKFEHKSFASLRQIYPNKQVNGLWDLFVKCNGDIDWAVDILLKEDELSISNADHFDTSTANEDLFFCHCENGNSTPITAAVVPSLGSKQSPLAKPQRQRIRSSRPQQRLNLNHQEVRETIENRFVLGNEHYSKHVRMVRDMRNRPLNDSPTKMHENAETQTDPPNDELEDENNDDILELSLGANLVEQLTSIFKEETTTLEEQLLPEKLTKNIFIPRMLAKELYMLWMESVYNQMEEQRQQTLREDEDFARLLKNPKYEHCTESPSNVRELLDMEMAWMIYNSEHEKQALEVNHKRPNDLASHLTQLKLCEIFPDIPQETLLDIMAAHDNRFSDTVEVLQSTMDPDKNSNTAMVTLTQEQLLKRALIEHEMLNQQAAKQVQQQQQIGCSSIHSSDSNSSADRSKLPLQADEAKRLALRDFEETRNLASHHSQLKAECYQKAKEAIQKGNSSVAVYYSQIANLHKKKIDIYNHRAANCIVDVHKYTQNNPDLLDLHYLHVVEAVSCLDLFLDRHITGLRNLSRIYKHVFIITGRGLHSIGGVSAIKNKVKSRLKERNLRWSEVNPGLLKVKLFSASRHSKNI